MATGSIFDHAFVTVVTLLGVFVLLVVSMPSGFYSTSPEYSQTYGPQADYIEPTDLESIAYFLTYNISYPESGGVEYDFDAEGATGTYVNVRWTSTVEGQAFSFWHETWRWLIFKTYEQMFFTRDNYDTGYITLAILENYWDSDLNSSKISPIYVPDLSVNAWFTDPDTSRNNITQAWSANQITVSVGFGWDNATMGYSAWSLVSQLLTFQSPQIHWTVNMLIAIPIWSAIGYLVARIILLIIPFVG